MMKIVIGAVVALVVVAGAVVIVNSKKGDDVPGGVQPVSANIEPSGEMVRPETHVIECGNPDYFEGTYLHNGTTIDVLVKGESTEGGVVKFLKSPKWFNKCSVDDIKEKPGKLPGLAIYKFNVERDDTFYVFLRATWTDTCGNSVWILMDGPEKGGHGPEAGTYYPIEDQEGYQSEKEYKVAWHPLKKQGRLMGIPLKKGAHTIELHTREDGPRFDQLVISTEGNVPVGVAKKK